MSLDTPIYSLKRDRENRNEKEYRNPKTIRDLQIGDIIYDSEGLPTKVIHLNPIIIEEVYEVEFEDGEIIECNGEHLWYVYDKIFDRHNKYGSKWRLVNTDYIYYRFNQVNKKNKEQKHNDYAFSVPMTKPIKYPKKKLIVHPFVLGEWLGDGSKNSPQITCNGENLEETVNELSKYSISVVISKEKNKVSCYSIYIDREKEFKELGKTKQFIKENSLIKKLKKIGVKDNKHIPEEYLTSCIEDRILLLQGLMNTDGTIDKLGHCEFIQNNKVLMDDFCKLLGSLGIQYTLTYKKHTNYIKKDRTEADTWRCYFIPPPDIQVFTLSRKLARQRINEEVRCSYKKAIVDVRKTGIKKPMRCITVNNQSGLYLTGNNYTVTHNSYLSAPFTMARSLLFPSHNSYIMAPSGSQSVETFTKLENLAKNNIASVLGVSSFFLDETVRINAKADSFSHDKNGHHVALFNGASINTLNSVAKNIVGIRSNLNLYDEAGKIDREYFALTVPFTVQNTDFATGGGFNQELYPKQIQNKNIYMSSAEGIDSELFDQYKLCMEKMLLGDPNYFVVDQDCQLSLHPFINGKPAPPLVSQSTIDDAFATNPYKAAREYNNIFDQDGGSDVFVKRSVINKCCQTYYPVYANEGQKKYIIAYDPASKLDNSMIICAELFEDEEKGLMAKFVYAKNLIEIMPNNEKVHMQKPEQIEFLKDLICDFNLNMEDYDGIDILVIDAGAGGGGFDIGQFLMNEWNGKDKKKHKGWIDLNDQYMSLRKYDYPDNINKLKMFNFKRDKVLAYERAQSALNQGLVIIPTDVNVRNELEFETRDEEGSLNIRYEKVDSKDLAVLNEFSLMKEELVATQKTKTNNGNIRFELSPDAKNRNLHDDRADCAVMILNRLMELRAEQVLKADTKSSDFKKIFINKNNVINGPGTSPFKNVGNPFKNNSKIFR